MLLQGSLCQVGPLSFFLEVVGEVFAVEEDFLDREVHLLEVVWLVLVKGTAGSNEDREALIEGEPEGRVNGLHWGESASGYSPPSGVGSSA